LFYFNPPIRDALIAWLDILLNRYGSQRTNSTFMIFSLSNCLFRLAALVTFGLAVAAAQTQDISGNKLLNGSFQFRHVAVQAVDANYNPTEITATFGTIKFDGAGNYTVTATTIDNTLSSGAPQGLNISGTYAIGSNGTGYVANPLYPTDPNSNIYGAVAQGVYTGSSTEEGVEGYILNDIFIAIPAGTPLSNSKFTSPYQTGLLDFTNAGSTAIKNALFKLSPNGQGGFSTFTLTGQAANQSASILTQTVTGATYNFNSDGSATLTVLAATGVSAANSLFTGTKTLFPSADGNFILGWTANGYDIFFGVKALTSTGTNSITNGLYFTAALEDAASGNGVDAFYGSSHIFGNSAGDAVIHERLNVSGAQYAIDFGIDDDQIDLNPDGTVNLDLNNYQYGFGDNGLGFVSIGTYGNFSLVVGIEPSPFSGPGVYLNPIGIVNAASYQPITASLAPGEIITLFGTGLASGIASAPGGNGFSTTFGGVSVSIDGFACPVFYVSPTQISAIVPYEVASNQTGLANIQVTSNQIASNVVQMYLTDSAPGVFSQNEDGIGFGDALHAANNTLVTPSNPAQPGEYLSLYMAGLGTVTPGVADGAPSPTNPLSVSDLYNAGNLAVYFNDYGPNGTTGNLGTIGFAGLAPYFTGLYQLNVQVPSSGLSPGDDVYIEFVTDAADVNQIQIPYGDGATTTKLPAQGANRRASVIRAQRLRSATEPTSRTSSNLRSRSTPPEAGRLASDSAAPAR